jgi:hypothetical protein
MVTAKMLRDKGSIPFIRLMMRSHQFSLQPDEYFTLRRIISGEFDCDLKRWADAAVEFGTPLIVEYGTEVNGDWFPWSAPYNLEEGETMEKDAGPAKVPGLFKSAFRHIVELMRERGAYNITWAFHIYSENYPQGRYWNQPKNYYPGDDVVDWVGISAYASEKPCDHRCPSFESLMTSTLAMMAEATTTKPFFLFELGVTDNNPGCDAKAWLTAAMNDLLTGRWPNVKGFAWWNENWMNGRPASCTAPTDETVMMVQKSSILGSTLRQALADGPNAGKLVDRPIYP